MEPARMNGQDTSPESVRAGLEKMASGAEPALDQIADFARQAAETMDLEDVSKLLDGIRAYIREYPLAAVALGVAVGYLISRLTRSPAQRLKSE
jgi:ElaB/YqjD/DUF883 family membrane-anchored ribosome-binding protein